MRTKATPKYGWNDGEVEIGINMPIDAAAVQKQINASTREISDTVGMSGSLGRASAGAVRLTAGGGLEVTDGERKTQIEPDGDFFVGSNLEDPAGVSFAIFVVDQNYNVEDMDEGDILIGDNSDGHANVKWDHSAEELQFRIGQTVNVLIGVEGALTIAQNVTGLSFGVTDPAKSIYFVSNLSDYLDIHNTVAGAGFNTYITLTDASTPPLTWEEDQANTNVAHLSIGVGTAGTKLSVGNGIFLWADVDGEQTIFNEDGHDIDFQIKGDGSAPLFFVDAADGRVGINTATPSAPFHVAASSSLDGAVIINDTGADRDIRIESDGDANNFFSDGGTNRIGIGTDTPGSKLDVVGSFQADSITNDTGLASGTYTPTLTNTTNISASTLNGTFDYIRIGDRVLVTGCVSIDPTAAGNTVLTMSLPIASNFATAFECNGLGSIQATNTVGNIASDPTADTAILTFQAVTTTNQTWRLSFMYRVI